MARTLKANLNNFGDVLYEDLLDWDSAIEGEIQTTVKAIATEAKLMIQDNAKRRFGGSGAYARSWRVSKDRKAARNNEARYIVHADAPYYRLTHLLENDHKIRNRKNGPVIGHYDGREHIAPAEARAQQLLITQVEALFKK